MLLSYTQLIQLKTDPNYLVVHPSYFDLEFLDNIFFSKKFCRGTKILQIKTNGNEILNLYPIAPGIFKIKIPPLGTILQEKVRDVLLRAGAIEPTNLLKNEKILSKLDSVALVPDTCVLEDNIISAHLLKVVVKNAIKTVLILNPHILDEINKRPHLRRMICLSELLELDNHTQIIIFTSKEREFSQIESDLKIGAAKIEKIFPDVLYLTEDKTAALNWKIMGKKVLYFQKPSIKSGFIPFRKDGKRNLAVNVSILQIALLREFNEIEIYDKKKLLFSLKHDWKGKTAEDWEKSALEFRTHDPTIKKIAKTKISFLDEFYFVSPLIRGRP